MGNSEHLVWYKFRISGIGFLIIRLAILSHVGRLGANDNTLIFLRWLLKKPFYSCWKVEAMFYSWSRGVYIVCGYTHLGYMNLDVYIQKETFLQSIHAVFYGTWERSSRDWKQRDIFSLSLFVWTLFTCVWLGFSVGWSQLGYYHIKNKEMKRQVISMPW